MSSSALTPDIIAKLSQYAAAGDRVGYWSTLAGLGDKYANLALGVAKNDTMAGYVANEFMKDKAAEIGQNINPDQQQKIGVDIMNADLSTRLDDIQNNNGDGLHITVREIYNYHNQVFKNDGLGSDATSWTLGALVRGDLNAGNDSNAQVTLDSYLDDPTGGLLTGIDSLSVMTNKALGGDSSVSPSEARQWIKDTTLALAQWSGVPQAVEGATNGETNTDGAPILKYNLQTGKFELQPSLVKIQAKAEYDLYNFDTAANTPGTMADLTEEIIQQTSGVKDISIINVDNSGNQLSGQTISFDSNGIEAGETTYNSTTAVDHNLAAVLPSSTNPTSSTLLNDAAIQSGGGDATQLLGSGGSSLVF